MNSSVIGTINEHVSQFNEALVSRDTDTLSALCSKGLSYGHSKGKIETHDAFINNVKSDGATQFSAITIEDQTVEIVEDNAIVRHTFKAETSKNGKTGTLEIKNMMVWKNKDGAWVLIARQAFSA